MPVRRRAALCGEATVMIMTTECNGGNGGKAAADDSELAMTALDAEAKREATPPSSPAISLKSVQERLSRFGSTVKFRTEAAAAAAESEAASEAAEEEEESCDQPQDLSVKRRDQGSQTDGDRARVTIRKVASPRPPPPDANPSASPPSEVERMMLRIWLVLSRRLAAAGAMQNKVDCCLAMWPFRRCFQRF